jgi:cytochrome c-type biogenesis protein
MSDFLTQTLPEIIGELSALGFVLVFLGGVLASVGPCNLGMVPVVIGYVGGQHDLTRNRGFWLSTFFTLGSSITFVILGMVAATVGGLFGTESKILHWVAALVCFAIGLSLLGALKVNLDLLSRLQPTRVAMTGLIGAFLLGLVVGLAGSQCGTPVLVAILGIVMAKGKLAYGAALLFAYGLGRGVPVVMAGTLTSVVKGLPAMMRWTHWMERAAGVILVGVGLYLVWIA